MSHSLGIKINHYPQLRRLAWNQPADAVIAERDALALYEREWRFVNPAQLETQERELIDRLVKEYGQGVLLV